jgi:CheY-like chemotaxis protein
MTAEPADLLIVDNDPAMLQLLCRWLEGAGYCVRTARDGRQAVEMIKQQCPEIVLTDWEMPQMDGAALCRWIRRHNLPRYVYTIGVLAEKDVMAIMLWPNWWETEIKDVMKRNVVYYGEDASVQAIYEFLCRVAIRGVIIVRDERPTGVISRGSVLRWFTNTMIIESPPGEGSPSPRLCDAPRNARDSLAATAGAVQAEAARLEECLRDERQDTLPAVVGCASRIQELVNDLLAHSRYLDGPWANGAFDSSGCSGPSADNETHCGLVGLMGTPEMDAEDHSPANWSAIEESP